MSIITVPEIDIIDSKLKSGDAVLLGMVTESEFSLKYWAIDDLVEQETLHVLVDDRPEWDLLPESSRV